MKRPKTVGFFGSNTESKLTWMYGNTIEAAHVTASAGFRLATYGGEGLNEAVRLGAIQGTQFMTPEEAFIDLSEIDINDCDAYIVLPGGYEVLKHTLEIVVSMDKGRRVPLLIASRAVNVGLSTFGNQAHRNGHTASPTVDWMPMDSPIEAANHLCRSLLRA